MIPLEKNISDTTYIYEFDITEKFYCNYFFKAGYIYNFKLSSLYLLL